VLYVADDDSGGMARRNHLMPDYWRAMADRCAFARAQTRESLRGLALEILLSNMDRLAHEVELVPFVWRNAE
jgi:hypothetical protein